MKYKIRKWTILQLTAISSRQKKRSSIIWSTARLRLSSVGSSPLSTVLVTNSCSGSRSRVKGVKTPLSTVTISVNERQSNTQQSRPSNQSKSKQRRHTSSLKQSNVSKLQQQQQ